jgi:hypothetical protein
MHEAKIVLNQDKDKAKPNTWNRRDYQAYSCKVKSNSRQGLPQKAYIYIKVKGKGVL